MSVGVRPCPAFVTWGMLPDAMAIDDGQPPLERAMARFAAGDDAALGDVYDLASPAVFTFLSRICRDQPLAEDLTQETFLRIHRARGLFRQGAAVMPWVYAIARRLFLDAMRARRTEARVTTNAKADGKSTTGAAEYSEAGAVVDARAFGPSAEDLLADRELAIAVDDALAKLPESQALAFRLLKGEGLSVAETAAVMGTTKGAVKLRAHRAYLSLRVLLGARFGASLGETTGPSSAGKASRKDTDATTDEGAT